MEEIIVYTIVVAAAIALVFKIRKGVKEKGKCAGCSGCSSCSSCSSCSEYGRCGEGSEGSGDSSSQ